MRFEQSQPFDLRSFLKNLTTHSGVYRMIDSDGVVIYVGKAKNLKNRVNSYFTKGAKDAKTIMMVEQIARVEITITPSDYEAFLLESTLIKQLKPKYNILFKDDKSYPYLALSKHKHPRLYGFRGTPNNKAEYFGPYVSIASVKDTLDLLQKLFPIRQCQDSFYRARTRPCLQYQIKRCLAPCVAKVTDDHYNEQVQLLRKFMQGKYAQVLNDISHKMMQASEQENYELASIYRDQLITLRKLQENQIIEQKSGRSFDVVGLVQEHGKASVALMQIEQGKVKYDRHWLISVEASAESILASFLSHHYIADDQRSVWPKQIILPKVDFSLLQEVLINISHKAGHSIDWLSNVQGDNARWQQLALTNAIQKLNMSMVSKNAYQQRVDALGEWLGLESIERIECFDISHLQGEGTVASCVVYGLEGQDRAQFRRYNIKDIIGGDDYAAIEQVVDRRIRSGLENDNLPTVMVIDGGKGQLARALTVLEKHQVSDTIKLLSLGKGVERISGQESIYIAYESEPYHLPENNLAFLLLRQVRDSAHDFAIKGQRKKVAKRQQLSPLEEIEGIGAKRKKSLLMHFGGWQELSKASIEEIAKVNGISQKLAQEIWSSLHG